MVLSEMSWLVRRAFSRSGIEPSRGVDWTVYDLMLSQLPRIVQSFRAAGARAEVAHLAFEPRLLGELPAALPQDIDISFVGSVSADHRQRIALLEAVARRHDLKLWGNLPKSLPPSSPLHRCFQGEVWRAQMYQTLRRSKITLNSHIDIAGREAGNMRLFEVSELDSPFGRIEGARFGAHQYHEAMDGTLIYAVWFSAGRRWQVACYCASKLRTEMSSSMSSQ